MRLRLHSACALALVSSATAQTAPTVTVRIHVADLAGAPVGGAEVSIVRNLNDALVSGQTDERGERGLAVAKVDDALHVVVRKIGFQRAEQFFEIGDRSIVAITIRMTRTPTALDTVKVTAEEDLRRKSYYINAEQLEKSPRPLVDALDVIQKLRPDMIWGRRGVPDRLGQHVTTSGVRINESPAAKLRFWAKYGYCPPVDNVFVNGARIRDVPTNPQAMLRRSGDGVYINARVATVLASIKPEHIAEMSYVECGEVKPDMPVQGTNAIHVVLKEGVGYAPGIGSYVVGQTPSLKAYRARLLGVFDEAGMPLEGVEVADTLSGIKALTTNTGTVALAYLPDGGSALRISKSGYLPVTLPVAISPRDTIGITVILAHAPH